VRKGFTSLVASVVLVLGAATAFAQQASDYVITDATLGSKYEAPPAGASTLTFTPAGTGNDDGNATVSLPFPVNFFHVNYSTCIVCTNGFLTFGSGTLEWQNTAFPATTPSYAGQSMNGAICAYWDDEVVGPQYTSTNQGTVKTWTTGSAPDRHFVVSWEAIYNYGTTGADGGGPMTFQVQFYELSKSIVIAYKSGSTWPSASPNANPGYTVGIQAQSDGRYQYPDNWTNSASANVGTPASDYVFQYPPVTTSGSVAYDRYVVDESGTGVTSQQNVPLSGIRIEAHDSAGAVVGIGYADSGGSYSVITRGAAGPGTLVVCSQSVACAVRTTPGGSLTTATIASGVSFSTNGSVGSALVHEGVDPGGAVRETLNICRSVQQVYDFAASRTSDTIPFLEILYSKSSALPTSYTTAAGQTPATMRVSGASSNPDAWDGSVIRKTYARHILGAIARDPSTAYSNAFDSVTDDQQAFAEGFGYYMNAAVTGDRKFYDGINATTTNVIDLEDAQPSTRKGSDVAAWVAEGLYDLTDPANESWDVIAGAGAAVDQPFRAVDSLNTQVTSVKFFNAWVALGYDVPGLSQNFIHHGLLPDDADEPNDDAASATPVAGFGFLLDHRVLNLFNDDWYKFTLPTDVPTITASIVYDRGKYAAAQVGLELRSAGGTLLGVGSASDATSPIKITTGPLPAGAYLLHLALTGGVPVPDYVLQAYTPMTFTSAAFQPWTVGKPYDVPLTIGGGIPPYALTIPSSYVGPTGLVLDGAAGRVTGVPVGPAAGVPRYGSYEYSFLITASDSARPANQTQGLQTFTLNDVMRSRFAEFVTFAKAKAVDRPWPPVGGTAPYAVSLEDGAYPDGLDATGGPDLRFVGTPTTAGSAPLKITASDVAQSTSTTFTTAVVCVPVGPADLAAGKSACGWYFDLVKDASVGLTIATAKKKPVRALRLALYDVDGMRTLSVTPKFGKGKASFTKFIAPSSGRFYCVLASDDDLAGTSFTCVEKATNPTSGKGDAGTFSFGGDDTLVLPTGVLNGGTITLTVKPDKKSGLHVKIVELRDPSGTPVTLGATDVKVKGTVLTFTHKVDVSGTWTVVVGAESGPRGTFTYAYKLKQPKGVTYSAD